MPFLPALWIISATGVDGTAGLVWLAVAFFGVYLPLATPALAIVGILAFNYHWNEFFRPLIFMITKERFTIPLGLFDLQGYMMTGSISVVLAGIVLSMLPVIVVYSIGQRYLIEGIMMGGVKS